MFHLQTVSSFSNLLLFIRQPGDNWDCRVTCVRYYCWNNALEESVLSDCTPEIKTRVTPALPKEDKELVYQSYTAMSVKYPETPSAFTEAENKQKTLSSVSLDTKEVRFNYKNVV